MREHVRARSSVRVGVAHHSVLSHGYLILAFTFLPRPVLFLSSAISFPPPALFPFASQRSGFFIFCKSPTELGPSLEETLYLVFPGWGG